MNIGLWAQYIVIGLLVAASIAYTVRKLIAHTRGGGCDSGCGSCKSGCDTSNTTKAVPITLHASRLKR